MPTNPRVRDNNVFGTVDDNPLSTSVSTMNSAGLANLSPVVSQHAIITLDPLRQFGKPEIVVVTAHTINATVVTITRGAYGTTAREHPQGTLWVHAPTTEDFTQIVTSTSRPSDPYHGQMIFETNTNKFVARAVGDIWMDAIPLGAWQTWTPVVVQGVTPTQSIVRARWTRIGSTVICMFAVSLSSAGTAGQAIRVTGLPTVAASSNSASFGSVHYFDAGNTNLLLVAVGDSTSSVAFERDGYGNRFGVGDVTIAGSDSIDGFIIYEAVT